MARYSGCGICMKVCPVQKFGMKIVMEPSSAVPLATILKNRDRFAGKRVGLIITGGNVDLDRLPWLA